MDAVYTDLVQKQLELEAKNAALEEAQMFIDSVLWSMTDILIVCDIDGNIVRTNAAAEKHLGRSVKQQLNGVFTAECQPFINGLPDRIMTGERVEDSEACLVSTEGKRIPLSVNVAPQLDHLGQIMGFVLIGRPIGELRKAFEALDQAHKKLTRTQQQLISAEKMAALGQLVAGVAHELNNPISFVFGNLYALKRYGDKLKTYLDTVDAKIQAHDIVELRERLDIRRITDDIAPLIAGTLEGAQRVSEIVQDLRRFSSTQKEQAEAFNLVRVVSTAADWVTKSARNKPRLEVSPATALDVKGLKRGVHQIIVNLVQNSVDVLNGQPDPRIDIVCRHEHGMATVTVTDNGPGIRREALSRVFEPFFTTKAVGEGTGLGLYVSYNLAQEMGGTLEAGNAEGGGAQFTLSFPSEG